MHTKCLECNEGEALAQSLSEIEMVLVKVIGANKKRTGGPRITEVGARVAALEKKMCKSEKRKNRKGSGVRKKNIERAVRILIEWEVEEASGGESFDSFE